MAPLAGMLAEKGYRVTGSDKGVYPPASTLLKSLGITWKEGFREENLSPAPDLVVIGNAISRGNPELEEVLDRKIPYRSLPEVLKEFFLPGHDSIVVTGTHGKTTTTAMLAWIFHVAGRKPDFLVGGVVENFGKSYGLGGGTEFIVEGDEYDSAFFDKGPKFLHYRPDDLMITSLEFDHADIYADLAAIELQFRRLVNLIPRGGRIVCWGESATVRGVTAKAFCKVETYGFGSDNTWIASDVEFRDEATHFRAARGGEKSARGSSCPCPDGTTSSTRSLQPLLPTAAESPMKPSSRPFGNFAAWPAACRFAARSPGLLSSTISRTIRRPFAPPSKALAAAGLDIACGWPSSLVPTPCAAASSRPT